MPFNVILSKTYNENKPCLVFGDLVYRINPVNLFASRFIFNTAKILAKDFNVFMFSLSNNQKAATEIIQSYGELNYVFLDDSELTFFTKKQAGDLCVPKNLELVQNMVKRDLTMIKNVKGVFIRPCVLFKGGPDNELFDSISNDPKELAISNEETRVMNQMIKNAGMYAYTMFMTKSIRTLIDTYEFFINRDKAPVYTFVIDPAHYDRYYITAHNGKTYYFEDDFRGNRQYHKYPMGQLNYFYNYHVDGIPNFEDKEQAFIWGGVVLFPKGNRMEDWHLFLKDFNYERSVLHVAKGNVMKKVNKPKFPKALLEHELFEVTKESIENHPLNEGILPNSEFEAKLKDYKYTFIQKCISKHDSLNFRIYYALLYNMIPFVAYNYDLGELQIPHHFKEKLEVNNGQELMAKIDYYEKHPNEALSLLNDLKDYYINHKYSKEDYYYNLFKTDLFKEIYQ